MDSSFRFDRINFEWSIAYIERFHVLISKYSCISFSKDHFVLTNSVDPDEMPCYICSISFCSIGRLRPLVKSAYQKINFLISQPKHMLWVLKRIVSMRQFF